MADSDKFKQEAKEGAFVRPASKFMSKVGDAEFPAEAGRYRLYVAHACPWAHRCTLMRALKGLEEVIPMTWTTHNLVGLVFQPPFDGYMGWEMDAATEPHGFSCTRQIYEHSEPGYVESFNGARPVCNVPILFDEKTQKIVSNESAQILTMFNSAFNAFAKNPDLDLYPEALRAEIDECNTWIYPHINDGVYRCGFASTQDAYDTAVDALWEAMDKTEAFLEGKTYLVGNTLTLADVRLFPTLLRFDSVYYAHFKAARNFLAEMPNLLKHTRLMIQLPGVKDTINMGSIVRHYYICQKQVNPTGIVPRGPRKPRGFEDLLECDFSAPAKP